MKVVFLIIHPFSFTLKTYKTEFMQMAILPIRARELLYSPGLTEGGGIWVAILYFRKSHNTSCLLPKILYNDCVQFLLGHEDDPREIKNNAYANF